MSDFTIRGRVLDLTHQPIERLWIAAYDDDVTTVELLEDRDTKDDLILPGLVPTNQLGEFEINTSTGETDIELIIKVYNSVKLLLYELEVEDADIQSRNGNIITLVDFHIDYSDHLKKFLVKAGHPAATYISRAEVVEFLVDNEAGWRKLAQSIAAANEQIHLLMFYMDVHEYNVDEEQEVPKVFLDFAPGHPQEGQRTRGTTLERALLGVPAEVNVRLLVRNLRFFQYPLDTASRVTGYFEDAPIGENFLVKEYTTDADSQLHAKIVIIDEQEAYILGSPILREYFDDPLHRIDNPKRGELFTGGMQVPIHDVNLRLEGEIVAHLEDVFRMHWNVVVEEEEKLPFLTPDPQTDFEENAECLLQVTRTLPGNERFASIPAPHGPVDPEYGEIGIFESYLRAFDLAESFIYLENQYITSYDLADALVLALKQKPDLVVIMLVNNKVDIPFYGCWQKRFINRIDDQLKEWDRNHSPKTVDRIGVFTLWTHELEPADPSAGQRIIRNYVHSKVAIVDDRWATVGSANLDDISLLYSAHQLVHRSKTRETDVNVSIINNPRTAIPEERNRISSLRRRLWAEHLGYRSGDNLDTEHADLRVPPTGGNWLNLWIDRAASKLNSLKIIPPQAGAARILPYYPLKAYGLSNGKTACFDKDPDDYLEILEVDTDEFEKHGQIMEKLRGYSFVDGEWLD